MNLSKQLTRRECVLLAILGVLLLFSAYFFLVHRPVTEGLARTRQEREELAVELTVLDAKQQSMTRMQAELDALLQQPNTAQIPHYDNLEQIMGFLDTLLAPASDYTLGFNGLTPDEDTTILRRVMTLTFTCDSYQLARDIVLQMQNCPYRCQLDQLGITPAVLPNTRSDEQRPLTQGPVTVSLCVTFFETAK